MSRLLPLALIAAAAASASPAAAAGIVRHTNPAPAVILEGVTIPAGTETLMLSGQLADPITPGKTAQGWDAHIYRIAYTRDVIEDAPAGLTL